MFHQSQFTQFTQFVNAGENAQRREDTISGRA